MTPQQLFDGNVKLVGYVVRTTDRRNTGFTDREDMDQVGLLGLWKACLTFDPARGTTFSNHACTCIRNEILSEQIKLFSRKRGNHIEHAMVDEDSKCSGQPGPLAVLLEKERQQRIRRCCGRALERVSKRARAIIRDKYQCGLTWEQIAGKYGFSSVKTAQTTCSDKLCTVRRNAERMTANAKANLYRRADHQG